MALLSFTLLSLSLLEPNCSLLYLNHTQRYVVKDPPSHIHLPILHSTFIFSLHKVTHKHTLTFSSSKPYSKPSHTIIYDYESPNPNHHHSLCHHYIHQHCNTNDNSNLAVVPLLLLWMPPWGAVHWFPPCMLLWMPCCTRLKLFLLFMQSPYFLHFLITTSHGSLLPPHLIFLPPWALSYDVIACNTVVSFFNQDDKWKIPKRNPKSKCATLLPLTWK